MSALGAFRSALSKYATFRGRARRTEFWWWYLSLGAVMGTLVLATFGGSLTSAAAAATLTQDEAGPGILAASALAVLAVVPSLALLVRRLHDTGREGWHALLALVPIVGPLRLLAWAAVAGDDGPNDYGPDPRGVRATLQA